MSYSMLENWIKAQQPLGPSLRTYPLFYRNLEEALDERRKAQSLYTVKQISWKEDVASDFSSNDTLSLSSSLMLRQAFTRELEQNPHQPLGAAGVRLLDGNYEYLETVEKEIASFHGAETGLMVGSGYEANITIFSAIPRSGDVVVYDELVHASTHDGMEHGGVFHKVAFRHNDIESLREVLVTVQHEHPLIKAGQRSVIVAVESFYSMDGDICPLKAMVEVSKEVFPMGNCQFVVDEAHSTGVVGPKGAGLVCELGLEKEIAIRMHTFGKALASTGAIILGAKTVKSALINFARSFIYTTGPSFPTVAAARAVYTLLRTGQTLERQAKVQTLIRHFLSKITASPVFEEAEDLGICSLPMSDSWEQQPFLTQMTPIWTRPKYNLYLIFHLHLAGISAFPISYPIVPKGQDRVRISFHAGNTEQQVDHLVEEICGWAKEMIAIEYDGKKAGSRIPKAARTVYDMLAEDGSAIVPRTMTTVPKKPLSADSNVAMKTVTGHVNGDGGVTGATNVVTVNRDSDATRITDSVATTDASDRLSKSDTGSKSTTTRGSRSAASSDTASGLGSTTSTKTSNVSETAELAKRANDGDTKHVGIPTVIENKGEQEHDRQLPGGENLHAAPPKSSSSGMNRLRQTVFKARSRFSKSATRVMAN